MKMLETFVNEKLKVSKSSAVPSLISILESTNREEFMLQCENLLVYLEDNSYLPIAELTGYQNDLKSLDAKYQNRNDTFLWVMNKCIYYGTWDKMYSMYWSRLIKGVKNHIIEGDGFNNFTCNDREIIQSKGVFIITENNDLMEQINYLMEMADHIV